MRLVAAAAAAAAVFVAVDGRGWLLPDVLSGETREREKDNIEKHTI